MSSLPRGLLNVLHGISWKKDDASEVILTVYDKTDETLGNSSVLAQMFI